MSSESIRSGQRWLGEVNRQMDEAEVGIICVTRTNQAAPWLNFEAGAIARRVDQNQVIPIAIDLSASEIKTPLSQFQSRRFDKQGINDLILDLNASLTTPRTDAHLARAFELYWPLLESRVDNIPAPSKTTPRPEGDKIDEILQLLRGTNREESVADIDYRSNGTLSARRRSNDVSAYRVGSMVKHSDFGLGEITQMTGTGQKTIAQVSFADGPKRLLLAIAPLEIVTEDE